MEQPPTDVVERIACRKAFEPHRLTNDGLRSGNRAEEARETPVKMLFIRYGDRLGGGRMTSAGLPLVCVDEQGGGRCRTPQRSAGPTRAASSSSSTSPPR